MTQCINATELHMDVAISHIDGLDLKQGLSSTEVHKRALAARKLYGKAEKALTFWIMEMDERKLYKDLGCSNVFQYATNCLSLGEHTIAEFLRTGKALAQLPLLSEAFEKGQISSSHIREISRVATEETEQFWCDTARGKTVREVEKLVAFTPKGGLPGMNSTALKPVNSTALKPVNSTAIQPAHSMKPAISVESAISSAQTTASEDVMKCTSEGETLQEPVTDPGMSRQGEQSNIPVMSAQEQSATVEALHQPQGSVKYHEKLVMDLDALQMSVLQDAFTKARKESGLRDRASLLVHIAKAFLEGCPTSGKRRKPHYQIVLHRHLPSGLAWCDTLKGERPVSPDVLEKALCDAEIVELDEQPAPTWEQNDEKETHSSVMKEDAGSKNSDILNEAHEYVNEQYMSIKAARRKGRTHYKSTYRSIRKEGRAIPAPLRKKVLLRDGCACQAPGCGRKIFLTIHHLIAFALCGIHSISCLLTLCSRCHALVHEGKLSVEGEAPHRLIWRNGKGTIK
ncbi:MAG: HNH endonuclease [Candidatus Xenobiia bacterium LiM19]